jgi:RNA polymerase sigma-70 factor (ECF subfamily)
MRNFLTECQPGKADVLFWNLRKSALICGQGFFFHFFRFLAGFLSTFAFRGTIICNRQSPDVTFGCNAMEAKQIFEILMRENAGMLLAFLRSGVRDGNVADDLFQETMLVAWRRLENFDRSRPFGPWLRGIAGKIMLTHFRTDAKQAVSLDAASLEWLESRFAAVQKQPGDTFPEKLAALRDCVGALPDHYREPVQMRYQQELPLGDIVDALSIAMETLKKRLTRAKSQLAECLERKLELLEQAT